MTWIGRRIHLEVYYKFGLSVKEIWQENQSEALVENDNHKIWDFLVQTNHTEAWRPNLIVMDKENCKHQIIDFAVPKDTRVNSKETTEKYQGLDSIPGSIDALGRPFIKLKNTWGELVGDLQKTAIIYSVRILCFQLRGVSLIPCLKNRTSIDYVNVWYQHNNNPSITLMAYCTLMW